MACPHAAFALAALGPLPAAAAASADAARPALVYFALLSLDVLGALERSLDARAREKPPSGSGTL